MRSFAEPVSSAADFYLKVKEALCHKSVEMEEDREGLGFHLGRGLIQFLQYALKFSVCMQYKDLPYMPNTVYHTTVRSN